jgi:PAS domain S-box-containing protein
MIPDTATRRSSAPISGERRLQLLVDAVTDYAIYMLDADGFVSSWNSGAQRIKGYTAEEVLGRHFSLFFTEEDIAQDFPGNALRTARETGRFESEGWRVRKDGSRFWAVALLESIRDETGELIGFAKITRDITERRAEREALRESERRFRLLVQGVVDYAIFMLDTEGYVSNWNTGAQRLKGYRADEIVGQHFSRFYTEEDRASGLPARVLRTAQREGRFEAEGWRVRKDGTRFWANVVIDPIRDETGQLIGYAKVTRDMTERREAQRKLDESQALLFQAQKMEAVGQLTGGVAHDFNNLLTIILGGAEVALRRISDERVQRILANIRDAAERGASLTQQLLAFSRRQTLQPEIVEAGRLLESTVELLRRSLRGDIKIAMEVEPDLPPIRVDPRQLELALLNIGLNARDAMPDGGTITLGARRSSGELPGSKGGSSGVAIFVADTGSGMSKEVRERAFEPFFTTKEVGKGSGLGLSQAFGFAQQSGGSIAIESDLGQGTTVTFCLPASDEQVAGEAVVPDGPLAFADGRSILVVEDEPGVAAVAEQMLADMGHRVRTAPDAEAALAIIENGEPVDLVFSDVMMAGSMNGFELARTIRRSHPKLPILLTTGYSEVLTSAGVVEFPILKKPYGEAEIARSIDRLLAEPLSEAL